jgi:hypothetical protein
MDLSSNHGFWDPKRETSKKRIATWPALAGGTFLFGFFHTSRGLFGRLGDLGSDEGKGGPLVLSKNPNEGKGGPLPSWTSVRILVFGIQREKLQKKELQPGRPWPAGLSFLDFFTLRGVVLED